MSDLYRYGKDLYDAAIQGARKGIEQAKLPETQAVSALRRSAWYLAGAAGAGAAAAYLDKRKAASRGLTGISILLAALAFWNSRNLIGEVLGPAGKAVGSARDRQWLRQHPIDYA